jgi:hypothetical protein
LASVVAFAFLGAISKLSFGGNGGRVRGGFFLGGLPAIGDGTPHRKVQDGASATHEKPNRQHQNKI